GILERAGSVDRIGQRVRRRKCEVGLVVADELQIVDGRGGDFCSRCNTRNMLLDDFSNAATIRIKNTPSASGRNRQPCLVNLARRMAGRQRKKDQSKDKANRSEL